MSYVTMFLLLAATLSPQVSFERAMEHFSGGYHEEPCTGTPTVPDGLPVGGFRGTAWSPSPARDSLIIGDVPGETLLVSGNYSIPMDVYIVNDGVLMLRNANCTIGGNIFAMQEGMLDCDSSHLHFLQEYIYHYNLAFADSARFILTNSSTDFNGFPIGLSLINRATLLWKNVDNRDWTTAIAFGDAVDSLVEVNKAGEWLVDHRSSSTFISTDTLLVWFFFGDSSVVDFTFPDVDTLTGFVFDSTLSTVSNVGYRVEMDTCSFLMWGMFPLRGSTITISDSKLRTVGLMFGADAESLSGIVNGMTYGDYLLPLADRTYHLMNTYVNTWSFYPSDSCSLTVTNSIFGECVGMGRSEYLIQNAFCDGSGGHIETTDQSFGLIFLSSLVCDVITKGQSVLLIGYSSVLLGNIWATGSSIMALVNTSIPDMPCARDTSIVFIDAVTGPATAQTYELVPVRGSAMVLSGPYQTITFDRYELFYRPLGDSTWIAFDSTHHAPVYQSILGYWNTDGLTPGYYELSCQLFDTYGNCIETTRQVNLLPGGVAERGTSERGPVFSLACERKGITIRAGQPGMVSIYDITGRCLDRYGVHERQQILWRARGSGVYFIRFIGSTISTTKKVVLF